MLTTLPRRRLLHQLAFAAAGVGRVLGANDRVRAGLIGCGGIARTDLRTFFSYPEVDCAAVCDIDDGRIAEAVGWVESARSHRPDTAKDFRRIIDRKDVDILLVCTPDHWHALPTVRGCQAGKDVYCEKPLAPTIAEGRAMLEAAKRHNRIVQMGTQWRSGRHYQEAVEFVRSGRLGKIRQVRAWAYLDWVGGIGNKPDSNPPAGVDYDMWLGPAPTRPFNPNRFHFNFRWFWDYAGGLMTDWGVHLLNIALWAMGPESPKSVTSTGGKYVLTDDSETPDSQLTVYEFPTYSLIWEHQMLGGVGIGGRPHGLCFSGSEATLTLDAAGWEVVPEPKKKEIRPYRRPVDPNDPYRDGRRAHVGDFLECVRTRKPTVENFELGHFVSTVSHLGNLALRSGAKIVWDAAQERVVNDPKADALVSRSYRQPWMLPYMPRS
jgi:predicted dehydrogenase